MIRRACPFERFSVVHVRLGLPNKSLSYQEPSLALVALRLIVCAFCRQRSHRGLQKQPNQ